MLEINTNPFDEKTGSSAITKPKALVLLFGAVAFFALVLAKLQMVGLGILLALIIGGWYLYKLFNNPLIGFYTAIGLNFIVLGATRYITGLPLGFGIDGIILLTYLALFFSKFRERIDWSPVNKNITYFAGFWLLYCIFQLVNPEAQSKEAWIAGRGIGFYFFLFIPLTIMLVNTQKKLDIFLYVWGVWSLIATLKGMIQLFFGVDAAEQAWLNGGAAQTHILFGKLRIFSFMSDAGQFGANQGLAGVVGILYSMSKKGAAKVFFLTMGIMGLYGMLISGTRGSISVPFAGFMTYFILSKNVRVVVIGFTLVIMMFVFFKFTLIANGNDQIRRMRSAFDPNEPSLQVRLNNQKILKGYLASRPFGGGIGHAGDKAQRFLPNAFLSHVATDSWYVMIWAELGVVGLTIHLFILFFTVGKASYKVMFKIRDPIAKQKLSALIAGMLGIMAASYGNAVFGGMPTALLMYATIAIISNPETFDTPIEENDLQLIKS